MKSCIAVPEILLPKEGVDMGKWAVIACDQHTSDPAYWEQLEKEVADSPSTLRVTLPEIYLERPDCEQRIADICATLGRYMAEGLFRKLPRGFVLVTRKTLLSAPRTGLVLAVDLEEYSFLPDSKALIRASEATILERIPPRLKIRERVGVEFPHILLLYNDPQDTVLGPLKNASLPVLYDFTLNMGGGSVCGKFVSQTEEVIERFGALVRDGLLFMVGDGNHSLATAKASWDKIKETLSEEERKAHPARFALCEAVNLYDEGLGVEAIHRVVKGIDVQAFVKEFCTQGEGHGTLYVGGEGKEISLPASVPQAVDEVDKQIAAFLKKHGGSVDYIHGEDALRQMTAEHSDRVGIALAKMEKSEMFAYVAQNGNLPRKTFSLGESEEKRYYIEGKEIR